MNFELNEDQQAILEAIDRLLAQHAGPARAIELNRQGRYDDALHQALDDAGFSTIARDLGTAHRLDPGSPTHASNPRAKSQRLAHAVSRARDRLSSTAGTLPPSETLGAIARFVRSAGAYPS